MVFEVSKYGILVDPSLCIQCLKCIEACEYQHGHKNPGMSYTDVRIIRREMDKAFPLPLQCRHCADPPCVKACIGHALTKLPEGPVLLDQSKCVGCLSCLQHCPFDSLSYDAKKITPIKCDMCYDRLTAGLEPACVEACPTGAKKFGSYEEMVAKGRERAEDIGGQLLYPGDTGVLYVFNKEKLNRLAKMGIFPLEYPVQNRSGANILKYVRKLSLPLIAVSLVMYVAQWRKNRLNLVKKKQSKK